MTDDRPDPRGDERAEGDGPEERDVPELDPDREAAVRGLLGDARETAPPPPEVAARLEEALAALGRGEEPAGTGSAAAAPVLPLRRRRVRRALVAAGAVAATVVVAVPVTMSVTGTGGDSASTAREGGAAEVAPRASDQAPPDVLEPSEERGLLRDDGQAAPEDAPESESESGSGSGSGPGPGAARGQEVAPTGGELLLSRDELDEQVAALVESGGLGPVPAARCGAPRAGRGIAVRYEGVLGVLRLVPADGVVRAELYVCGRGGVVRTLAVPAR